MFILHMISANFTWLKEPEECPTVGVAPPPPPMNDDPILLAASRRRLREEPVIRLQRCPPGVIGIGVEGVALSLGTGVCGTSPAPGVCGYSPTPGVCGVWGWNGMLAVRGTNSDPGVCGTKPPPGVCGVTPGVRMPIPTRLARLRRRELSDSETLPIPLERCILCTVYCRHFPYTETIL